MDLMRLDFYRGNAAAAHRNSNKVVFKVVFLRVHGDWACTCVERINADGKPITEPAWALLRRKANQWTDTNYFDALRPFSSEEAAQDALDMSPETIRRVRKRFPNAPADIFPKPNEWHY